MNNYRDTIKAPLVTEKTSKIQMDNNTYTFKVATDANKTQIKQAIENIFKVKVLNVQTSNVRGKYKKVGKYDKHREPRYFIYWVRTLRMRFNRVNWFCLCSIGISKMVWLATVRAENFASVFMCSLETSLSSLFIRLLIYGYPCLMNTLCHFEKFSINNL